MEDVRNFETMREVRFCVCGWSVFGTDLQRRNALAAHRQTELHKRRLREQARQMNEQHIDQALVRRTEEGG